MNFLFLLSVKNKKFHVKRERCAPETNNETEQHAGNLLLRAEYFTSQVDCRVWIPPTQLCRSLIKKNQAVWNKTPSLTLSSAHLLTKLFSSPLFRSPPPFLIHSRQCSAEHNTTQWDCFGIPGLWEHLFRMAPKNDKHVIACERLTAPHQMKGWRKWTIKNRNKTCLCSLHLVKERRMGKMDHQRHIWVYIIFSALFWNTDMWGHIFPKIRIKARGWPTDRVFIVIAIWSSDTSQKYRLNGDKHDRHDSAGVAV